MNDYPQAAVDICKDVLKFRDDNPDMDCGTLVGWNRANQIAKRENLSTETIKRTYSFLARAKTYDTGSYTDKDGKYVCGSIMYAAWGGNPMLNWAKSKVKEMDEKNVINIKGGIGDFYNDAEYFDYQLNQLDCEKDLEVNIDSLGGSFFDAISMYHSLKKYKGHTTAIYSGLCASAATIVAAGCNEIAMTDASAILIHKVMNYVDIEGYLNGDDLQDVITQLKKVKKDTDTLSSLAASIYAKKSGKTVDEMLKQMKSDSWILPQDALDLGLIDRVIETQSKKAAKEKIEQLQNKIQGVEMVNSVSLPPIFNTKNDKNMNIKEVLNGFLKDEKQEVLESETQKPKNEFTADEEERVSDLETKIEILIEEIQAIKEMITPSEDEGETETEDAESKETEKEQMEALNSRLENIEKRDNEIAQLLQGFVEGVSKNIEKKLNEQEAKIKQTVTELQLKENAIVTGDKTYEGKPATTAQWIQDLSQNFKN
jgi:ATP-dependent protease ClpP protease subunit